MREETTVGGQTKAGSLYYSCLSMEKYCVACVIYIYIYIMYIYYIVVVWRRTYAESIKGK